MKTSLAEQLTRLATPQTKILVDSKKRPSILFDHKEAANKDRKTIYDIGHTGLVQLISLNPIFLEFEQTLFDPSSISIERSVESVSVNKLLNGAIKKFFHHLSPYVMLQPAHFCIEWLIRRYNVHEFNKDDFIALILPYHETNIFIKCIQILNFKDPQDKWKWLGPLRKPGIPLSKSVLLNRAATDLWFVGFICKNIISAVKELGSKAHTLQCQINFYCTTVIGALENVNEISESYVSTILSSVLKGFSSKVIDFTAAAFMITAQLISKVKLNSTILQTLIEKTCLVEMPTIQSDIILLLLLIYQTQDYNKEFPENCIIDFIAKKWIIPTLLALSEQGVKISVLCVPLVGNSLRKVQTKQNNWLICKKFLENLIADITFSDGESKNIIRSVLENYHKRKALSISDTEVIELDNENEPLEEDIQTWYSSYLQQLERQYPMAFDSVIKETMNDKSNISESRKQALKTILAFRLKSSYSEDNSSIYENLYHYNVYNRVEAVRYLAKNFQMLTISDQGQNMIKDTLLDRLNDDNPKVVKEVLKLSTENILKILDNKIFVNKLINILSKYQLHKDEWTNVKSYALNHLAQQRVFNGSDLNKLLLALIPLCLSRNSNDLSVIKQLKAKEIVNAIPIIKNYLIELEKHDSSDIGEIFQKVLNKSNGLPQPESLLQSFENVKDSFYKSTNCAYLLLLLSSSFTKLTNNNPEIGLQAFNIFEKIEKRMQFIWKPENFLTDFKSNEIHLRIALDFIISLANTLTIDDNNCKIYDISSNNFILVCKVFEFLLTNSFTSQTLIEKQEYNNYLKKFLDLVFPTATKKLEFMSHFFVSDRRFGYKKNFELQIRAIKMFNLVLNGKDQNFLIDDVVYIKVLLSLCCQQAIIRECSLETLKICHSLKFGISEKQKIIAGKILKSKEEILLDSEQFPLVLFIIIFPRKDKKSQNEEIASSVLNDFLKILNDRTVDSWLKASVLNALRLVNNSQILEKVIHLGLDVIKNGTKCLENNDSLLDSATTDIFKSIVERFDENTIKILTENEMAWNFIQDSLIYHQILFHTNGKVQSISTAVMNIFETSVYAKMPIKFKEPLLKQIVNTITYAEENSIPTVGTKLLKRIDINGNHIINILSEMKNVCDSNKIKGAKTIAPDPVAINTTQWKCGITLLELLQNIKNIENFELLIPLLFDILKNCLDFEEQISLDYTKQLILSCLLNLCQKVSVGKSNSSKFKDNVYKMDLVVQCIRTTQNPQTHHHSLMLLSHCASIIPQKVLHNIMDVFTFMGSSVVRHDDSFSFQIIFNIIESVIPTLVEVSTNNENSASKETHVIPILKVFSDIILDVPEHRRLLLYTKLLRTLNANQYLWMFLCVLFESHVVHDDKEKHSKRIIVSQNVIEEAPKRLSIALQLCKGFEPNVVIETCVCLFAYLKKLPIYKVEGVGNISGIQADTDTTLFLVDGHSAKQLRHFKYIILQFISTITSSTEFVNAIAALDVDNTKLLKPYYQNFIIKILSFIPDITSAMEKNTETNQFKYWKVILHHCYDILDNSISLLSPDMLLVVVHGLMQHQIPAVRKKVIELLISKLQYKSDYFENCNQEYMLMLLDPLKEIVASILAKDKVGKLENITSTDIIHIQQLSLIAVKLLSKILALKYLKEFKELLTLLAKILKKRSLISKIIMANVVLAISEISSNLKAHSISHLSKFMPYFIDILNDQAEILLSQSPDNVCIAIVTGIQKLFETLPLFLGPYLVDICYALIKIWIRILPYQDREQRTSLMNNKLTSVWLKISTAIPLRILIPTSEKVYCKIIEESNYKGIEYLMKILTQSFNNVSGSEINVQQNDLTIFFLKTLEFRSSCKDCENLEEINEIEKEIVDAFVCLILKLSESSFRPLYQKMYDWAIRNFINDDKEKISIDRAITYFVLSSKIAEALKSLFVLFAGDFIQDAANLLNKCNIAKLEIKLDKKKKKKKDLNKSVILLESILKTLYNVFLYDTQSFMNPHRFDILMQPIADQLENSLVIDNQSLQEILLLCISQLAVVVSNDTMWKQMNYQILLKTRTNRPEVRILAFNACVEIAKKLGEDFSSLLPETIPFVSELLEDENQKVEKNTRKGVQELEKLIGESLQKYF